MTWLAIRAFLGGAFKRALAWLMASTTHILIAALILALLWGWQGHRSAGKWHTAFTKQAAAEARAEKEAEAAQIAARNAAEARYKELATHADLSHEKALADARSATDHYIGSHRVQTCGSSPAAPPTGSSDPLVPDAVPASVVVDQADVRTCGDLYTYALNAHQWALSLAPDK